MFIIAIIHTILYQNRQQIPDSKTAKEPTKLSKASWAFLSWALLEIILSCAYLQVQTQFITPKNGFKWRALFHYRLMKQQFHDSVIKYDSSIMPCFDIVVPHNLKVAFHSKYYVEKLLLPQWSLESDLEGTCHQLVGERDCSQGLEVGEIQVQQYQQIWNTTAIFKEKEWCIQ